jgi:queuosine precursor transporter
MTDKISGEYKYFTPIAGIFVGILLISNTVAGKFFSIGSFSFPSGVILFPVSYIFGDVLTEVYGYKMSRRIIWTGMIAELLMAFFYTVVVLLPPAGFWHDQASFAVVLGQVPRTIAATITGYFAGEFTNSYIMARLKVATKGRYLWVRTIGSTIAGEGIDTMLFILIAFAGTIPSPELLKTIPAVYLFKVLYEIAATPLTYLIVNFLKKKEGVDIYDFETNFSPFRW